MSRYRANRGAYAPQRIPEPFIVNQADENMVMTDTTAGVMTALGEYRVPLGTNILLSPHNVLAMQLFDTVGAAIEPTAEIRLELRSPLGGGEAEPLVAPTLYELFAPAGVGEFRHTEKLVRLQISQHRFVIEQAYIALQVRSDVVVDAGRSFFEIRAHDLPANRGY